MTNTNLLKEKIAESGYKLQFIAKQLGITYQALLNKINNVTEFKAGEIQKLCDLLHIADSERSPIFFARNVDEISTS